MGIYLQISTPSFWLRLLTESRELTASQAKTLRNWSALLRIWKLKVCFLFVFVLLLFVVCYLLYVILSFLKFQRYKIGWAPTTPTHNPAHNAVSLLPSQYLYVVMYKLIRRNQRIVKTRILYVCFLFKYFNTLQNNFRTRR